MKRIALIGVFFILIISQIYAQDKKVKSKIVNATVYSQGAQITREAKVNLDKGENKIIFTNLPSKLDESSVQVSCSDAIIVSVSFQKNMFDSISQSPDYLKLQNKRKELEKKLKLENALFLTLETEKDVLLSNKELIGDQGIKLEEFKASINYFRTRVEELEKNKVEKSELIAGIKEDINKLQRQMDEFRSQTKSETGEILVNFKAEQPALSNIELKYFTQAAGWFPNYDIRVNSVNEPFILQYKANIYQTTGEDWKKIKLKVSSGNPTLSSTAPEISPWYLDYQYDNKIYVRGASSYQPTSVRGTVTGVVTSADDGLPLPGVSVIVSGTTVGTVTNIDGRYSINLPNQASSLTFSFVGMVIQTVPITSNSISVTLQPETMALEEVVVTGYGAAKRGRRSEKLLDEIKESSIPVTKVDNRTSFTFQIDLPYDIPSTGRSIGVTLNNIEIPANYSYTSVPKLQPDAFLIAEFTDWSKHNLLDGEANLYLEDKFVGSSVLQVTNAEDTISLSLGKDDAISIKRVKIQSFKEKNLLGNKKTENREFEIAIRNGKNEDVSMIIKDQIPVTTNEEIKIKDVKIGDAKLDNEKGLLKWEIKLKAGETKKIRFSYSVEYQNGKTINLE